MKAFTLGAVVSVAWVMKLLHLNMENYLEELLCQKYRQSEF